MAYCWDDDDRDRPHSEPYTYTKNGVLHAACDRCGWHSFGLPGIKRRIVVRWAEGHVCPEPRHTYRPQGLHGFCARCGESAESCGGIKTRTTLEGS